MKRPKTIHARDIVEKLPYIGEYHQPEDRVYHKHEADKYFDYLEMELQLMKTLKKDEQSMNILAVGTDLLPITRILNDQGFFLPRTTAAPLDINTLRRDNIEFVVSYRYQHIIKKPIIDYLQGKIINLHISLLPWNRGADPNLWSFLEDTPKGVSIHYIDEGLDTGDIIAQKEVAFNRHTETLLSTYEKLNKTMIELFRTQWPFIINENTKRKKQLKSSGSYHKLRDKEKYQYLLKRGRHTPINQLIGKALNK